MKFNFDRTIKQKPIEALEYRSLYSRAIIEVDSSNSQVGGDLIPWAWTTSFIGTELLVRDNLRYDVSQDVAQASRTTAISIKLTPGTHSDQADNWPLEPCYSFIGVDRPIVDWRLEIKPAGAGEATSCTAWGSVSFDHEVDFRDHTTTDCVVFTLIINQSLFDRYLWNIAQGFAGLLTFRVGEVDGFYSEWSPGISTEEIKVLAGSEQVVEGSDDDGWPRLGRVGKADFLMHSRHQLDYVSPSDLPD